VAALGLMFAGQGAQAVGMGKALYDAYAVARETFRTAEEATGLPLRELCFEGPAERLGATEVTQPALLTVDVAAWRSLVHELGGPPPVAAAAGLSLGEYAALVAAEAVDFAVAVRLVRERGRLMQEAVPRGEGGMLALIGLTRAAVEDLCREAGDEAAPANYNCPGQVVVSGRMAALERVRAAALAAGARRAVFLDVSAPFHMALLAPAREALLPLLEAVAWRPPAFPVVANLTARAYAGPEEIPSLLARQVDHAVDWEGCVAAMRALGAEEFLELGPGRALSGFARRILPGASVRSVAEPDDIAVRS